MSYTPFLAKATALLFLLTAVALFALRDHNPYWGPLFGACFAGVAASTAVGLVVRRRASASGARSAPANPPEARAAGS